MFNTWRRKYILIFKGFNRLYIIYNLKADPCLMQTPVCISGKKNLFFSADFDLK